MSEKSKNLYKMMLVLMLIAAMAVCAGFLTGCSQGEPGAADGEAASNEGTQDIVVLYTSDVHCAPDQGWGYAGLVQIRETLEAQGNAVLLVDNGDAIQGGPIGSLSDGKDMAALMNKVGYDVAIPGNHEFGYGVDNFLSIVNNAAFPYICCNLMNDNEHVLDSSISLDCGGKKIAFVGATTPSTIMTAANSSFQDENGNYIYSFLQEDKSGQALYDEIQKNVDEARAGGADYVILLAHLGMGASGDVWDYASVAENTSGIDAILDGHSHDKEQVQVKNSEGKTVLRSACGTRMEAIGWLRISGNDGSMSTGLYKWDNSVPAPVLMGIDNDINTAVTEAMSSVDEQLSEVIGTTEYDLVVYDPEAVTEEGDSIRIVRRAETNLGDLVADSLRVETGADIGLIGGGSVRTSISKGDITMKDIINVMPFNNDVCVSEVTGQQILDALEWGVRMAPNECGGFLQVSGLKYEFDTSIKSTCFTDENGSFAGVEGERRVTKVTVGDEPLDVSKKYTVAGQGYIMQNGGDGLTMFSKEDVVRYEMLDSQTLTDYIKDELNGVVGEEYGDPYGNGRITAAQ